MEWSWQSSAHLLQEIAQRHHTRVIPQTLGRTADQVKIVKSIIYADREYHFRKAVHI
jgi:hypothetical protein